MRALKRNTVWKPWRERARKRERELQKSTVNSGNCHRDLARQRLKTWQLEVTSDLSKSCFNKEQAKYRRE